MDVCQLLSKLNIVMRNGKNIGNTQENAWCSYDILLHYENLLQLSERKLPVGLAQVVFSSRKREFNPDRFIFHGTPSAFSSTDVKSENGKQIVEVKYPFPWGEDVIERVTNYGSKPIEELEEKRKSFLKGKDGRRLVLPHVITSEGILEGGMLAYLLEAYQSAVVPGQKGKRKRQVSFL
ncbi:DNA polymerase subunit gamma-2, mitochondrial [Holothuria leucospilota]|uniref:DNA polymerase subunit gamma-2, mitochondrial n=1 Tax=Holothuria leucospilota TaxID=206669 RepID=A0A9Q1BB50_HOLLE|nr:DNA polymerase subunit gamma-2, mitochondrial [Holothuria leucospilota]